MFLEITTLGQASQEVRLLFGLRSSSSPSLNAGHSHGPGATMNRTIKYGKLTFVGDITPTKTIKNRMKPQALQLWYAKTDLLSVPP